MRLLFSLNVVVEGRQRCCSMDESLSEAVTMVGLTQIWCRDCHAFCIDVLLTWEQQKEMYLLSVLQLTYELNSMEMVLDDRFTLIVHTHMTALEIHATTDYGSPE